MPFEEIAVWLFELIKSYGAISVFIGVVIEEIIVPIPSSLVIMGAGALLVPAGVPLAEAVYRIFFTIVIPASAGTVAGSMFVYAVGYYGGKPILKRYGRFLDLSWSEVERWGKKLGRGRKIWLSIALLRATPVFPTSPVSFLSGTLRLDLKKYAAATFVGSIPRIFVLSFFGWYFGSAYASIAGSLNLVENAILATAVLAIAYLLYRHHRRIMRHVNHHVGRHVRRHINRVRKLNAKKTVIGKS